MGKVIAGLPEDVKIGPDALPFRSACRYRANSRQRRSECEDQESPPPHRFAISITTLSIAANINRLGWA